jgi:small subunit ribosomal protein S16
VAVRVRLTRVGNRKNPVWRVVVADQRSPRDGRVIETVGRYNAQTHPSEIVIDRDRVRHWLARGAQPSGTVKKLLRAEALSATGADLPGGARTAPGEAPAPPSPEPAAASADGEAATTVDDATPEGAAGEAGSEAPGAAEAPPEASAGDDSESGDDSGASSEAASPS